MGYEYSLCLLPQFWVGCTPPFPLHLTLTSNLTLRDALFWFEQLKNRNYHIQVMPQPSVFAVSDDPVWSWGYHARVQGIDWNMVRTLPGVPSNQPHISMNYDSWHGWRILGRARFQTKARLAILDARSHNPRRWRIVL